MNENEKAEKAERAEQQYIDFTTVEDWLNSLDNLEPIDILKVGHTPGKEPHATSQDATSDSDLDDASAALMGGSLFTADARPNFRIPYVC